MTNRRMALASATVLLSTTLVTGCGSAAGDPAGATSPATPHGAGMTALDGTYRWTLTRDDALEHGTANDQTPEGLAAYPTLFTMTLAAGSWELTYRDNTGQVGETYRGTVSVADDQLVFTWPAEDSVLSFAVTTVDDGDLTVTPDGPMNAGDIFVWTTNTWQKIG